MTPRPTRTAIVTDGLWRKSLSAIRSLGRAGFEVTVMGESLFTTGFWSRYARKRVLAPTASRSREAFGKALLAELRRNPGAVLLPMEDPSLDWVSENRESLLPFCQALLPSRESLRIAQDKSLTLELAEGLGLPCPRTWRPAEAAEFAAQASKLEPGTFVVKPRSGTGSAGVSYGEERRSEQEWEAHWRQFGPMLIQERVPRIGRGRGVSLLFDRDGDCVAAFAHERLQQYPNSGGPSTDRQSLHAPELLEMSIRLMKKLDWRGIAMVEWKIDPRDGRPRLMEINPRFWGSLELAVRAGIDFPALYARAALGEKLPPAAPYPDGVRCRWLVPGELLRFFSQHPSERETVFEFLRGLPSSSEEWDTRDLAGTLATVVCTGAYALNPRYWKYVRRG